MALGCMALGCMALGCMALGGFALGGFALSPLRIAWQNHQSHGAKPRSKKPPRIDPRRLGISIHEEAILSLAGLATTYSSKS
jgi:hypothetical protein